ncbi:hypothetical protein [Streptomyces sp. AK02-01A]|uniref:hypothetical protein n=1 Tax=Streptomyces sp. AK02-01A TaxID=3028648 RepID=UPI0029A8D9A3|nr:hypothetical protein [Streptomyces sp. AK02-01A]MDX3853556.1 hypothetical protein [Streptomyces sp. AK02-01A]
MPERARDSCAVAYAHELSDYNGHYGIPELCDICPLAQLNRCKNAYRVPDALGVRRVASTLPEALGLVVVDITEHAAIVSGLATEQPRYYLQHALGFQVHDVRHPHRERRHGRADIGWEDGAQDE